MTAPGGTHVLQQVSSLPNLAQYETQLRAALRRPGVTTLALRVPWNATGGLVPVFERGATIAQEEGKTFSSRFMAGRWTPRAITDAGPFYVLASGEHVPLPYDDGFNVSFESAFKDTCEEIASAAQDHPNWVLFHHPGYGEQWAELAWNPSVRANATEAQFIEAHVRLMVIARAAQAGAVEFPMSGSGPLVNIIHALALHAVPLDIIVQANGLSDQPGRQWGVPAGDTVTEGQKDEAVFATPVRRAVQMIGVENTSNWPVVYENCRAPALRGIPAEYVEVYLPSFSGGTSAQLYVEAERFLAEQEPPGGCEEDLALARLELADLRAELVDVQVDLAHAVQERDQALARIEQARILAAQLTLVLSE